MKFWTFVVSTTIGLVLTGYAAAASCASGISKGPRIFVLSDIANEPDDAQSLVRLLLYGSVLRIEGLVATTSFHLNSSTHAEQMEDIIHTYSQVLPNLKKHAEGWPEESYLLDRLKSGLPVYGMDGVGPGKDSPGSELLISAVDSSDEDLWVSIWGGPSVLAQALYKVREERSQSEVEEFVRKIRVYAISDQDNSATWIRRNFPQLFYIASVHHFTRYATAAWNGISGEVYYDYEGGPDSTTFSKEWVRSNIQSVGPFGARYPDVEYIAEGDTPAFLYLIPNGLSTPTRPEWGSWGGRYGPVNFGEGHHTDTVDQVLGADGQYHTSSASTIWRWRTAYQNDFAARMQWTVAKQFKDGNHAPIITVNGSCGIETIDITLNPGESAILDASATYDPDSGDTITYKWWQYLEPSNRKYVMTPRLVLNGAATSILELQLPDRKTLRGYYRPQFADWGTFKRDLHVILEVTDGWLVSYRRVVVHIEIPLTELLDETLSESKQRAFDTKDEL